MSPQISYTELPNFAILRSAQHFVHLQTRSGDVNDDFLDYYDAVLPALKGTRSRLTKTEFLMLRGIYYDDKRGNITYYVDLIHHSEVEPSMGKTEIEKYLKRQIPPDRDPEINVKIISENIHRDAFFTNAAKYYKPSPILR